MKLLTVAIPCYNSQDYMEKCIDSLLIGGEDVEIIIVDDGSKDMTPEIADSYAKKHPEIVRAIHQENGGHGEAVNTGIRNAQGIFFKVVDSDDWVDAEAYQKILATLRELVGNGSQLDMLISNFVYEKEGAKHKKVMKYTSAIPKEKLFTWKDVRHFSKGQYILMHSVIYRTQLLRDCGLELPKHTFYVDNLFVYIPLPYVKTLYYLDVDLYRYFIGRNDQSVNERVMISRIDQQIYVNKLMIDAYCLPQDVANKHLARYMLSYLAMICCVTSIMLLISGTSENLEKRRELWQYFKKKYPSMYWRVRLGGRGIVSNPPGEISYGIVVRCYRMAQKIYKFN